MQMMLCTTRELSKIFHVSRHMTIYRLEMKRLDWESLKGWEMSPPTSTHPHDLSEINDQQRVTCCVSLRSRELSFRHLF
ncbi:unnamed protein product [Hymenolepis diminuta]|uniref:Uncharacterized protein n=1 Tax=Hymenolepis diminuta TaxID=6216 RepID=A0A564Y1M3_HYMDI|nr:unnamed protein product [Hymenolepis diminuta]